MVQRECHAGVSCFLADCLRIHPGDQRDGHERMTQVIQANPGGGSVNWEGRLGITPGHPKALTES
jgi:hypothetical protein